MRTLFDEPRSQPEIELIVGPSRSGLTPHRIKRLLLNNAEAGFFLRVDGTRRSERYGLSELGRYAVGELATSARFEHRHMPAVAVPITVEDVVGALRAHLPLLEPPEEMEGICEFVVRAETERRADVALAWAQIEDGKVTASGVGRSPQPAKSWAHGTIEEWIAAVIDHRHRVVRDSGEPRLNQGIIDLLHSKVYGRMEGSAH